MSTTTCEIIPDVPTKYFRQIMVLPVPDILNGIQSCSGVRCRPSTSEENLDTPLQPQRKQQQSQIRQKQHTLRCDEVAYIFREPYMLTGYRVPHKDWSYYATSLFHPHNECFNIWTHLVAFFIFVYKVSWWINHDAESFHEPLTWAVIGFSFGTLGYSVLSTIAHTFQSKSVLDHYTFFQLDYIGIGLNATGGALLTYYFSGSESFYRCLSGHRQLAYEIGNFVLGFLVCVSCGFAKLFYLRPYTCMQMFLKMGVCGIHIIYGYMPVFFLLYDRLNATSNSSSVGDVSVHIRYITTFFIAVFFYASNAPERLLPGRFDFFGYGHGMFHIAMVITSIFQYDAAWYELNRRRAMRLAAVNFPQPTGWSIIIKFAVMITACIVFVVLTQSTRCRRVLEITAMTSSTTPDGDTADSEMTDDNSTLGSKQE